MRRLINWQVMKQFFLAVSILFSAFYHAHAQNIGTINGYVKDARTLLPIPGATIRLVNSDLAATSDEKGFYRISGIPTRTWNVEASATGYRTETKFDLPVTSGNIVEVNFELEVAYKELSNVIIKPGFIKPVGVVNSVQTLGITEIAKYPGANFDIAKVVQSLPGVSGSVGFRNDIIIRGGCTQRKRVLPRWY